MAREVSYTEEQLQQAVQAVKNGVPQTQAARQYGVPRGTLQSRTYGHLPMRVAKEPSQRLSMQQEKHLRDWILAQASLGLPPTHLQLKEFASRILIAGGDLQPLGKNWIAGFLRRNPEISTVKGKSIDSARINGASTARIKDWFSLLNLPAVKAIPPQHRYNMDETGILEGLGCNGLVLGSSEKTATLKKRLGSRCWTTIVECVSATGQALMPLVIFKGQDLQQQWFPDQLDFLDHWYFESSPKGWTSDSIALEWLKQVFIPQTAPQKTSPRLLIMDGHGSHQTDDFMYECFKNGIYLLFLPSHASHVLQPLDVSCFSPVKAA